MIVGLGNPGARYNLTRHNLGFLALDFYVKLGNLQWERTEKFNAEWLKDGEALLVKPQTFYNDSGRAVQEFQRYYKVEMKDILVIADDFNLEFGKIRFREKGTAGGNNGLKSVGDYIGTDFPRLRIGTANDELRRKIGDTDFVLGRFNEAEKANLSDVMMAAKKRIEEFLAF